MLESDLDEELNTKREYKEQEQEKKKVTFGEKAGDKH